MAIISRATASAVPPVEAYYHPLHLHHPLSSAAVLPLNPWCSVAKGRFPSPALVHGARRSPCPNDKLSTGGHRACLQKNHKSLTPLLIPLTLPRTRLRPPFLHHVLHRMRAPPPLPPRQLDHLQQMQNATRNLVGRVLANLPHESRVHPARHHEPLHQNRLCRQRIR